jgi:hypothetical protein
MTGDFDQALTAEEIALLATARELASSVTPAERAAMDAATAALKEGRIASYPAPKSRPRLTLKSQEEILRLAADLGYLWDDVNPVSAGNQVCRFLRAATESEREVRKWLQHKGGDFLRAGGFFRVLAPLLRDNLEPMVFHAPSIGAMFAGLLHLRNEENEPGAFEDVARVLAPPTKGKRKPLAERSRDEASYADFGRHFRDLKALERQTRHLTAAKDINNQVAARASWERHAPFPPSEHSDAVARYRTRRNLLSLRQLAALIWKLSQEAPALRSVPLNYEITQVATTDDATAEKAEAEINRLKERIKGERRRAVSRRKRTSK